MITTEKLIKNREIEFNKIDGPRVGDYLLLKDGSLRRLTQKWHDGFQTTTEDCEGSFYLGLCGASYSGSLDPTINLKEIELTDKNKLGKFWVFKNDEHKAHNGFDFKIKCRVFKQKKRGAK